MANELNIDLGPSRTGLTVTATLILNGSTVGSPVSLTETTTGFYSGNMPTVAGGVYSVRFLSAGSFVGDGLIYWDGTKERSISDLPTVVQFEARTLPSADYFVVSDYTAPPTPTDIWTHLGRTMDGTQALNISTISEVNSNISTLLSRLTSTRAGYLDKLNVTGTLAHSDEAAIYQADISALLTSDAYISSLPTNFGDLAITAMTGLVTSTNQFDPLTDFVKIDATNYPIIN